MNIFEIEKSKKDKDFIIKNGELEYEVVADIIETCKDIPFVGSLLKMGKLAVNYIDWKFTNKLAKFLKESESIDDNKKEEFFNSLTPKDNSRISSYLLHLLYTSEEEEKASIMGYIYKARLMDEIDNDMMLRLCSIVHKSFLKDLKKLKSYNENNSEITIETYNLINLGLIDNYIGGSWSNQPACKVNDIGYQLLKILDSNSWFEQIEG